MRLILTAAAASLAIATAGCNNKNENTAANDMATNAMMDNTMAGNGMGMTNTAAAALPAQQFTDTVAGSDMFEIQTGKLAQTMGGSTEIKDFGKTLVTDHTKSSEMLKAAAKKTNPVVALPLVLPPELKAKVDALKATKGADFDRLFVQQQTEGHQKTLDALKAYAAGGDQPSLKDFASKAETVVSSHLQKLQSMKM